MSGELVDREKGDPIFQPYEGVGMGKAHIIKLLRDYIYNMEANDKRGT